MIESVIKKATKKVHSVSTGIGTLKDAVSETMREWTRRIDDTHYVPGSAMGPYPFPTIVRDFQAVISKEAREQILAEEGLLPDAKRRKKEQILLKLQQIYVRFQRVRQRTRFFQ